MKTYISLLRGINVSGQKKIRMAELRDLYESLGLAGIESYLQSGNVLFASDEPERTKLAGLIETRIEQTYGYSVPVLVRDTADFQRIIDTNPFAGDRNEDLARLYVTFLYRLPAGEQWRELAGPPGTADEFLFGEQEIFLFCPGGYGRTKLSNNFFEKKLNVPATTRNWKTVTALYQMARER
jgi:uncharacterized protein (DUF1697 family)